MTFLENTRLPKIIIALNTLVLLIMAFIFKGASDDGDSLQHFFFSQSAFHYPEHFFHHWAKPIFVTLTSPFAQFGIVGIKVFNVFCFAIAQWLTYKIAKELNMPNAWLIPIIMVLTPMESYWTLSGLTEPLFAAWMIWAIYLIVQQKEVSSLLVLSFLPFVRSEGLIIICVFVLYLALKKRWSLMPILAVGHVVYGIIGAPFHGNDLLWPFHANPYATLHGFYGSGDWLHFVRSLVTPAGTIIYILLILGLLYGLVKMIGHLFFHIAFSKEELWLVYGVFSAYFIGHTAFWALGIFNSFGLMRVMIGVMPAMALICLRGNNLILNYLEQKNKKLFYGGLVISILALAKSDYDRNGRWFFAPTGTQEATKKMMDRFGAVWKSNPNRVYYFDAPAIQEGLNVDYFSYDQHRFTEDLKKNEYIPEGSVIIWDFWFSPTEHKMTVEDILKIPHVKKIGTFEGEYHLFGTKSRLEVFIKDSTTSHPMGILYENDFEKEKDWVEEKVVFSGKKSGIVCDKREYSPTFVAFLKDITKEKQNIKIRFSTKTYLVDNTYSVSSSPKVVVVLERNGKSEIWRPTPLFSADTPLKTWQNFVLEDEIPAMMTDSDKLSVYIWNPSASLVYLDDMKVELMK